MTVLEKLLKSSLFQKLPSTQSLQTTFSFGDHLKKIVRVKITHVSLRTKLSIFSNVFLRLLTVSNNFLGAECSLFTALLIFMFQQSIFDIELDPRIQ